MALDTTPGSATADSYASLEAATTRLSGLGRAEWAAGTPDAQEAALRRATAWLDGRYRSRFPGKRANGRAQSLEWPRIDAEDVDGETIADDEIPGEVVNATIEAAYREIVEPGSLTPEPASREVKRKRESVGPITEETEYTDAAVKLRPEFVLVEDMLSGILKAKTGSTAWVMRA